MVGLAVAVAVGRVETDVVDDALVTKERRGMAMAPAEGLFLAEVLFTNYTQRCDFKANMPISLEGVPC